MESKPIITNVILTADLCGYLDQQTLAIRRTTGLPLNRSQLLRGVIAGIQAVRLDFSPCSSEEMVRNGLAGLLKAGLERQ